MSGQEPPADILDKMEQRLPVTLSNLATHLVRLASSWERVLSYGLGTH